MTREPGMDDGEAARRAELLPRLLADLDRPAPEAERVAAELAERCEAAMGNHPVRDRRGH